MVDQNLYGEALICIVLCLMGEDLKVQVLVALHLREEALLWKIH